MTSPEDPKKYDVRIVERLLRKGLLSRKDYEKYLKALVDRSDNAITAGAKAAAAVADDDDEDEDETD